MAKIHLRNRPVPIEVPNEMAKKIKKRWLGDPENNIPRAAKQDVIDLEEWCGEYGLIKSIELDLVAQPAREKAVKTSKNTIKMVALNYQLQEGEAFM